MKLLLIVLALAGLVIGIALAEDDNEFADFEEDFEDTVNENVKKALSNDKFMEDNDDDGVVEDDDQFDHFTDNDEFEGFGGSDSEGNIQEPADPNKKAGEPKLTMAKVPLHFRNWESYWFELLFLVGLLIYFVNYAMGKNKNSTIANSWLMAHKTFLEEQFALVGDDVGKKETDVQSTSLMLKESDSVFTLWCSGRVCCEGMLVELKLIKRQDLLALTMGLLSSKNQDQVSIKAEISKDSMDTFVFAVCNKKNASKMFKDLTDLVSAYVTHDSLAYLALYFSRNNIAYLWPSPMRSTAFRLDFLFFPSSQKRLRLFSTIASPPCSTNTATSLNPFTSLTSTTPPLRPKASPS